MTSQLAKLGCIAVAVWLALAPVSVDAQRRGDRDAAFENRRGRPPPPPRRSERRSDQDAAFENRRAGRALPLRQLEGRVMREMRGADYMGNPIYFPARNTYRMTFMRRGRAIHVEVDAGSGRIVNRTDR